MLLALGRGNTDDDAPRLLGSCRCVMQIPWDFVQFRSVPRWSELVPRWSDSIRLPLGMGHTAWDFGRLLTFTGCGLGAVKIVICLLTCPLVVYIWSIQFI